MLIITHHVFTMSVFTTWRNLVNEMFVNVESQSCGRCSEYLVVAFVPG